MARNAVIMPKLGMYLEDVRLTAWLKGEGDEVRAGEVLFTLETDKAEADVEAEASGWLHHLLQVDSMVPIGGEVGVIVTTREEYDALVSESQRQVAAPSPSAATATGEGSAEPHPFLDYVQEDKPAAATAAPSAIETAAGHPGKTLISPRARALLRDRGLESSDVEGLTGTGPGGRITDKDVQRLLDQQEGEPAGPGVERRIPLRGLRGTIAKRMTESLTMAAQLTSILEIDVSALAAWRSRQDPKPGYTAIFLQLLAAALRGHPMLNSRVHGGEIEVFSDVNIGFAVHTEEGVIVPVLHRADQLELAEIDSRVGELTDKARTRELVPDDVTGGTFTLSNSGQFPVDITTAILNPPQTGILWLGRIRERPLVLEGEVVARPTVQACLTFDHRVVDGAPAAEFLGTLEQLIAEYPRESP